MAKSIAIFGAGGFGREVLQIILDINAQNPTSPVWNPEGFLVDPEHIGAHELDLPVLSAYEWLSKNPEAEVVVAIGASEVRSRSVERIKAAVKNDFATLIHPRAWVGQGVKIGSGSIICAGSLITTDIKVGEHVHINIGATVGHDAVLSDYVTLNPSVNVSGNVTIGEGSQIGTGSVLIPYVKVGQWSIVGAGSVVTKPIAENVTVVGSPARVIKQRDFGWHKTNR